MTDTAPTYTPSYSTHTPAFASPHTPLYEALHELIGHADGSHPFLLLAQQTTIDRWLAMVDGPPPEQGWPGYVDLAVQTALGTASMPQDLLDAAVATTWGAIVPPGFGMPAARLFANGHIGLPHCHAPPPAPPLPGLGMAIAVGALNVLLGNLPALRCGDIGIAPTCGGSPIWKVWTGSSNVFIGGKRAARTLFDLTDHCPLSLGGSPLGLTTGVQAIRAAAGGIGRVTGALNRVTLLAAATGAVAHGVAAWTEATSTTVEEDVAIRRAEGEAGQAVGGAVQSLADAALSAMHAAIGVPPPLVGLGTGGVVPLGLPALVSIGGLPTPDTQFIVEAAHHAASEMTARFRAHLSGNGACGRRGEPVDVVTGHVFSDHVDVAAHAGRPGFARHHDTGARDRVGDCGRGVRHTYERELDVWLHKVRYTDAKGVVVDFPAFRGRDRLALDGYVVTRHGNGRFEVSFAGETMVFSARAGVRSARLDAIRTADGEIAITHDAEGRFASARIRGTALVARRDAGGRIAAIVDELGVEHASFAYDRDDLAATRTAAGAEERFAYDDAHRAIAWRDARGYRFTWAYDAQGRCVRTGGDDGQWGLTFAYEKQKTIVTHASGLTETLHYDAYGTVLRIVRSDGGFLIREQDATGRVVRERDGASRVTELVYDEDGALVARRDRFGHVLPPDPERAAPSPLARTMPERFSERLGVDGSDEPRPLALPESLASLAVWALPSPRPRREEHDERDVRGRVTVRLDADGRRTELRRDRAGNVVERVDRDGRVTAARITGWNLVGATTDPIGRTIDVTYTATEEVRSYRDPRGILTEYGRDAADRLVSITRAGRLRETYAWDAGDRLVEKRDASDHTLLRITHDAKSALPARIALAEGGTIELAYDARGRVTQAKLGAHDARLERDPDGVVLVDRIGDRGLRRWRFGVRETTSLFERFETHVDRTAGLLVVRDPTGRRSSFDVARGRVVRRLANGTEEVLAIDPEGRLEGRLAYRRASDGALRSWAVRYERSGEGDVLSVWDSARGERRFEVDAAHRLEAETDERGVRHAYTRDAGDDLVAKPGVARAEHTSDGLLLRTDSETFAHDARDRLVARTDALGRTTRYAYDSLDQLVRAELPGGRTWRGSYDGLGRLRRFGTDGHETELLWDGDRVAAEIAPSGALRIHVYCDARALIPFAFVDYASVDAAPESGCAFFVFHDASGMPTQIEDASGRIVWWADRVDPYGALTIHEGAELDYRLRWPGHVFDAELGLHHNRFRAYDPVLARYLQPDPIGHAGSPHGLHAYAPNPLVDVDLLGLHADAHPRPPHGEEEVSETHPRTERPGMLAPSELSPSAWCRRLVAHAAFRRSIGLIGGRWAQLPSVFRRGWDPIGRVLRFDPDGSERERAARPFAPDGVHFDELGDPELADFAVRDHDGHGERAIVDVAIGTDRGENMARANEIMRSRDPGWTQPAGTTWHEGADRKTMTLVHTPLHDAIPHSGGVSRANAGMPGGVRRVPRAGTRAPPLLPRRAERILARLGLAPPT